MMSDNDFILSIRNGDCASVRELYASFRSDALRFLRSRVRLSNESCLDVYADSVVAFCNNVRKPDFVLTSSLKTYIFAICKHKALKLLNRQRGSSASSGACVTVLDPDVVARLGDECAGEAQEDASASDSTFDLLKHVLEGLGDSCRNLLEAFYVRQMSYVEIVRQSDAYSSVESARVQKSKCIARAKSYVQKLKSSL